MALVLDGIAAKDAWPLRTVGSRWAHAVRTVTAFEVVIYRRQRNYPLARFVLTLSEIITFIQAARLLLTVTKAVSVFFKAGAQQRTESTPSKLLAQLLLSPHCWLQGYRLLSVQLVLPVHMSNAETEPQFGVSIEAIAVAYSWLQERGVQVCLHLCSKAGGQLAPSPEAIRMLAPFFSSIDYHTVPDLLATTSPFVHGSKACFTDAQVEALPSASQLLQTLCISEHVYGQISPAPFQAQISSVAALSNLTKLHLTFLEQPDFRPLAQLTKIEDLALQCSGNSSDCSHIIDSNRLGLQSGTIASRSWADNTYAAAANVETLRTVVVKVEILTEAGAALVANLVHPGSVQVLIGACNQMSQQAFWLLSYGRAKITVLDLCNIDANQCNRLQTMHSLHTITLRQPQLNARNTIFTALQPQLTDLRLISCLQLTYRAVANIVITDVHLHQEINRQHCMPPEYQVFTKMGARRNIVAAPVYRKA